MAFVFLLKKEVGDIKLKLNKITFCSILISLATAGSFIPLFSMPFGGSVTMFSMLFICLTGFFYGAKFGMASGLAFGLIKLILKPNFVHPVQLIIDYILSFSALGVSGFFKDAKNGLVKGYIAGVLGRYLFLVLSGFIFFGQYAWDGWGALPYSIVYNGSYLFCEAILSVILIKLPIFNKTIEKIKKTATK